MIRVSVQLRYSDYDDRGHVNNAVYFTYLELARLAAWRAAGGGEEPSFILAAASVNYRAPAVPGIPLAVEISTGAVRSKAWVWTYRVVDERDGRLIADGETTQVMFDYAAGRSVEIPAWLRAALSTI